VQLVILSGPPGAGKSATAEALCERYDRMLHVEMPKLRDLLRMGRLKPWDQSDEGRAQRQLFISAACDLSLTFLGGGYGVVIDDVITPDELPLYSEALRGFEPAHFVVVLPDEKALLERASIREADRLRESRQRFVGWRVATVDPAGLTPALVADRVMALAAEGRALMSDAVVRQQHRA
jgi:chloramphenicol 3-O-phosphotransferase